MNLLYDVIPFLLGTLVGSVANVGIYRLAYMTRPIGPWGLMRPEIPQRRWYDAIPIFGWLTLRREASFHGSGFWIRPMFIEFGLGCLFVFMFRFELAGGLMPLPITLPDHRLAAMLALHAVLLGLMTMASFIDIDEQTIPDGITIPGTIFGLLFALIVPFAQLPVQRGVSVESILASSPLPWPTIFDRFEGCLLGIGILTIWCFVLCVNWNFWIRHPRRLYLLIPSILRPDRSPIDAVSPAQRKNRKRKRSSSSKPSPESPLPPRVRRWEQTTLLWAFLIGSLVIVGTFWIGGEAHWRSLLSSLLGLLGGGGVIWMIRISGAIGLRQEAMGFGDVTLMAMIGSFVGWQAALMAICLAPFCSLLVAFVKLLCLSTENYIPFGPYLCIGSFAVVVGWPHFWKSSGPIFANGISFVFGILLFMVVLTIALAVYRRIKEHLFYADDDVAEDDAEIGTSP